MLSGGQQNHLTAVQSQRDLATTCIVACRHNACRGLAGFKRNPGQKPISARNRSRLDIPVDQANLVPAALCHPPTLTAHRKVCLDGLGNPVKRGSCRLLPSAAETVQASHIGQEKEPEPRYPTLP